MLLYDRTGLRRYLNPSNEVSNPVIWVLFANITQWGPQARNFLLCEDAQRYHALCLAEHHVPQKDLEPLRADLASLGWRAQLSARPTGRSHKGTTGGTAVLTKKHVALDRFPLTSKFGPGVSGHDWSCVALQCRGATVLLCSLYLAPGFRLCGENQERFQSVSEFLLADGRPFVLLADWNVTPQELAASRWPEIINGTIVCPKDTSFTCTSGPGRLIDFA